MQNEENHHLSRRRCRNARRGHVCRPQEVICARFQNASKNIIQKGGRNHMKKFIIPATVAATVGSAAVLAIIRRKKSNRYA